MAEVGGRWDERLARLRAAATATRRALKPPHPRGVHGPDGPGQAARRPREGGRATSAGARSRRLALDIPWARCAPRARVRETIQSFMLGPVIDFYVRRRARGPRALRPPQAAGDHGRQPRQPPRHADHPAGAAAPVAPAHRGRRGRRLLLPQPPRRGRGGPALQHRPGRRAPAAGSSRAPPTTSTGSSTSAGTSCCTRRARARAAARSASCARAPRSSRTSTASRSSRCTSPGRGPRCPRAAPGRAARARYGCAAIPSRCASARPIHPDADRHVVVAELEAFFAEQAAVDEAARTPVPPTAA